MYLPIDMEIDSFNENIIFMSSIYVRKMRSFDRVVTKY